MSVAGLIGCPSRCSLPPPRPPPRGPGLPRGQIAFLHLQSSRGSYLAGVAQKLRVPRRFRALEASYGGDTMNDRPVIFREIHVREDRDPYKRLGISREAGEEEIHGSRNYLVQQHAGHKPSFDASYGGDTMNDQPVIFPRIHVRDPYKRLGISREAGEEEIHGARNYFVQQHAGHKPSVNAIESAYDKIIMEKFYERTNPKVDINRKVREIKQSDFVQGVSGRFRTPSTKVILKTAFTFLLLGALSVYFPTEDGPTLQVLTSFLATMYFIHDRVKSKFKSALYSIGAFGFSWLVATVLMVAATPTVPFVSGPRSFEVTSSLITYVLLWVASSYLQ